MQTLETTQANKFDCWLNGTQAVDAAKADSDDEEVEAEPEKPPDADLMRVLAAMDVYIEAPVDKQRATVTSAEARLAVRVAVIIPANLQLQIFFANAANVVPGLHLLLTVNQTRCNLERGFMNKKALDLLTEERVTGSQLMRLFMFKAYNHMHLRAQGQIEAVLFKLTRLHQVPSIC